MSFAIEEHSFNTIEYQINTLTSLAGRLSQGPTIALEDAIELVNHTDYQSAIEDASSGEASSGLGLAAVVRSIFLAIKNTITYILETIWKAIKWIFDIDGFRNGSAPKNASSVNQDAIKAMEDLAKDKDIEAALKEAEGNTEFKNKVATEDIPQIDHINVTDSFKRFKESLSDNEIDFITSGKRYKLIKRVVAEFTHHNYPAVVSDHIEFIQNWITSGIDLAPHVGRGDAAVKAFMDEKNKELERYQTSSFAARDDLLKLQAETVTEGVHANPEYLDLFQKKPSVLFPHIERILTSIEFHRIRDTDKHLLKELDTVRNNFQKTLEKMMAKVDIDEESWPPLVEMARAGNRVIRESMQFISSLVHVAVFIRSSAKVACGATMKAFNYIKHLLGVISRLPNVDRVKIDKAVDVIHEKYKEIHGLLVSSTN